MVGNFLQINKSIYIYIIKIDKKKLCQKIIRNTFFNLYLFDKIRRYVRSEFTI